MLQIHHIDDMRVHFFWNELEKASKSSILREMYREHILAVHEKEKQRTRSGMSFQEFVQFVRSRYSTFPERYDAFREFAEQKFPGIQLEHISEDTVREIVQKNGISSSQHSLYTFPFSPKNTYIYATFPDNNTPEGREQELQRMQLRLNLRRYMRANRNIVQKLLNIQ